MTLSGKPSLMKKINKNIILNLIREQGPISRAKLSIITKISRPTMSNLIESLKKEEIIIEKGIGPVNKKGGKKPVLYEFNKKYGYVIGSQLRINEIKTIISDFNADILYETTLEIENDRNKEAILKKIFDTFEEVIKGSGVERKSIKGIGLGLSGIVDTKNGLLVSSSHFPGLGKNLEIAKLIENEFKIKTYIDNSARMMSCAEKIFGAGRKFDNVVTIDTEEGIGAGVIIRGDIYRGFNFLAGEIGHTIIDPNGPKCYCGKNGCAEIMISTKILLDKIKSNISNHKKCILYEKFYDNPDKIVLKDVFDAYTSGDDFVCSVFEEIEDWFSIIIGNIMLVYSPEAIIISGEYVDGSSKFVDRLRKKSVKKILPALDIQPNIILSSLGKSAGPIGSVSLVLNQMINFHNVWNEEKIK